MTLEVTKGDSIFNKAHKYMINSNYQDAIVFTRSLQHNNLDIYIEMIRDIHATIDPQNEDLYSPICTMIFRYDNYLYQLSFWNSPYITYLEGETDIHEEELKVYLAYLDEILIYK